MDDLLLRCLLARGMDLANASFPLKAELSRFAISDGVGIRYAANQESLVWHLVLAI